LGAITRTNAWTPSIREEQFMWQIRPAVRASLCSILAALALGACSGGDGTGLDIPPPLEPSFSSIQANVFTPSCATAGCHQGASAPQGLRLEEALSYAMLVNVVSSEDPNVLRVAPGNPGASYLVQKIEGSASVGAQMPLNAVPLPQVTIDVIRQWITDGALDDRTASRDPIRVTSLTPEPGSEGPAPGEIVATFDRELDVSTVNANTFLLEASGGDGTFDDGNEAAIVPTSITTPMSNPMSATMDLSGVTLQDDAFRVRLLGSGASIILDLDANALDGEYSGTFPSGDGVQGGDFEATFVVSTPSSGATLDAIQAAVFTPSCATAGCHTGEDPPQDLRLDEGFSFENLVDVPSNEVPELRRVEPGNPDDSYLVQKIEGTAEEGARMPLGAPPLDQSLIDDIREWITNDATQ
jgi:hypothetical protein